MQKKLNGVIIATPTPLKSNEDVDISLFSKLVEYIIQQGASGIMTTGTMGEGTALLDSQRFLAIKTAVEVSKGRVPILATVSDVSTRRTLELAKAVQDLGPDYIVTTSPFYYKFPDNKSVLGFLETISKNIKMPLIFYNAPGATGNSVDANTLDQILHLPNVAGVKDSSGNFNIVMELLRRYPDKSSRPGTIMQGDETMFDVSLLMGADGVVTGGGVAFISMLVELYKNGIKGDKNAVHALQREFWAKMMEMIGPNLGRDWMVKIKQRLCEMGVCSVTVTSPFLQSV
jgi:4-hydroxy-tetrahydrodipicolinate synthase